MTIFAINDVGQISGYYVDASGAFHGFVETQKQFHTIDVPGAAVTFATTINNFGVVAGEYFDAAGKQYGVAGGGIGPEISVKFDGVAGSEDAGIYTVKVPNVPDSVVIRVQTGPAINGTDLRDTTGTISFEQFTNQIDYQNAGYAINTAMKKAVLSKVDTAKLTGKTISVVGVFQLINPNGWLVTPVKLDVK